MSQENLERFSRLVLAINDRDVEGVLEGVHPDAVFEPRRAATEGAFSGRDGVRRFMDDTGKTFEVFRVSLSDVRDLGARLLATGSIRVRGRGSGVETDIPTAIVAEFKDGLLWRFKDYREEQLALDAAGLGS